MLKHSEMKTLDQIKPFVRLASFWTYNGSPHESTRMGYLYAFHLFTGGKGEVEVDGIRYPVERGSLIFIRPGSTHSFHHAPGMPLESNNVYCDLWEKSAADNPRLIYPPFQPDPAYMTVTEPCRELDSLPVRSVVSPYPFLTELLAQVTKGADSAFFAESVANSLMQAFVLRWYNALNGFMPTDYRIVKLMDDMERSPEKPIGYTEWCRQCGLEKSHFYKLFKRETGMTPTAYLLKIKMKKAAILLQDSRQSITSIAEGLGYDSIHYFSKQFTSYYGISPTVFRGHGHGSSIHD